MYVYALILLATLTLADFDPITIAGEVQVIYSS